MTPDDDNETVLYEVNLDAEAGIEGPFDTWLRDHIADVLQFDGFLSAEVLDDATAPEGRIRRIVQYRLRNQAALEEYLREHAPRMRAQGVEKFGERYTATRRVLAHREEFIRGAFSTENCLNCGEVLRGQHCSHCGQRAKVRVLSLGTLLRDLLGDLTNFDSRIWRTLRPLAFRPGALTVEYLRGRRTHYSPPFRMYLILSVVFFVLTTLGGNPGERDRFRVSTTQRRRQRTDRAVGRRASAATPRTAHPPCAATAPATPATRAGARPGSASSVVDAIVKRLPAQRPGQVRAELEKDFGALTPEEVKPVQRLRGRPLLAGEPQHRLRPDGQGIRRQAARRLPQDRGRPAALWTGRVRQHPEDDVHLPAADRGRDVRAVPGLRALLRRAPAVLRALPRVLLPGRHRGGPARRGSATSLRGHGIGGSPPEAAQNFLLAVLLFYVPYYLYRAMRRVYGQGPHRDAAQVSRCSGIGYLVFMTLTLPSACCSTPR